MSETLRFKDFTPTVDSVYDIGADEHRPGVVEEIRTAFGYEADDLGGLIGEVAPSMKLQENIEHAKTTLADPDTREKIGYGDQSGIDVARAWSERSGLQDAVLRPLMQPADEMPEGFAAVVITDGVVNWMNRVTEVAKSTGRLTETPRALLVSGGRNIGGGEHPDVEDGTPSVEYMTNVLLPDLEASGLFGAVEVAKTDQEEGQSVMARAAQYLLESEEIDLEKAKIVIASVAGNWMQKGSQLRSALKEVRQGFDEGVQERQLWVASDAFPTGVTGEEPKSTHQNPYSAIGNILRGAKLLDEQK